MDSYGEPELLDMTEYDKYDIYMHLTEKATTYLREKLSTLDKETWNNECAGGVYIDKKIVVFEIPNKQMTHCQQIILKEADGDFRIFYAKEDITFDLDVLFMKIRVGGIKMEDCPSAFLKKEVRLFSYDDDIGIDFG
mgnify:FL=1|jgi:hypothetical protein